MTPADFRKWRLALGMTQREAASALDVSVKMIKLYERGASYTRVDDDGAPAPIVIPRTVELACYFLLKQSDRVQPFPPIGEVLAKR